jgi:hypothetical protein
LALSKQEPGYIYRCICKDAEDFSALVERIFGKQVKVWAFGMNSIHVQPITEVSTSDTFLVDTQHHPNPLTSGHIFTATVEVRWKRRDGAYDVLVLTENDQIAGKLPEVRFTATYDTRRPKKESPEKEAAKEAAYLVLATPRDVQARRQEWRLGYVEYRDPDSGAVQLVRYTERIERPRSR